jgi:hypothetical protein
VLLDGSSAAKNIPTNRKEERQPHGELRGEVLWSQVGGKKKVSNRK